MGHIGPAYTSIAFVDQTLCRTYVSEPLVSHYHFSLLRVLKYGHSEFALRVEICLKSGLSCITQSCLASTMD